MKTKLEILPTPDERSLLDGLDTPAKVQAFLNTVPYSPDEFYRCPLRVLRDRKAHCFDGALFAAMAMRRCGHPPLVIELIPNGRDDDHMITLYKKYDCWGAVAQSNFTGIRFRDPVFRTVRELVMSYFDDFINSIGEKTLVGYRGPMNLATFDSMDWMACDDRLEDLADGMDRYKIRSVITAEQATGLTDADERSLRAALLGANPAGLFKLPK